MAEIPQRLTPGIDFEQSKPLINNAFQAIDNENRTKIVKDGATPQVLLGYQKDGFGTGHNYGLKIAKTGFDVTSASNDQLSYSSAFNTFKIVTSGTATLSVPAGVAGTFYSVDVSLGVNYVPATLVYLADPTLGSSALLPNSGGWGMDTVNGNIVCFLMHDSRTALVSGSARLTITAYYAAVHGSNTFTYRYYALQETAG